MRLLLLCFALCAAPASAQAPVRGAVLPQDLQWREVPNFPGARAAWVVGGEKLEGLYAMRAQLGAGVKLPPHVHPDERYTTVLSGTLYVGFGESPDEARMFAVPAGGVYVAPAGVAHYVWARDGAVVYQEAGRGPTATKPVVKP